MEKKTSLITPTLAVLLFSMIMANIGGQMYGPMLPLYVQQLGADLNQIGLFFTFAMIAPLLFQILGGWMSDSIGRVQAMAIGSVAGFAGYVVFVVSPSWAWLLLATVGLSVATSFVGPSFQALVAEEAPENSRGKVFGLVQGIFLVVGVIGAPLGGWMADAYGFRWMFGVAAGLYGIATIIRVVMAYRIQKQHQADVASEKTAPREKPSFAKLRESLVMISGMVLGGGLLTWLFISDGVRDITFSMGGNLFPLYMNNVAGISRTELGLLGAITSVAAMAFMALGGWLSDKFGERVGISIGYVLVASALFTMLNSWTFGWFVLAWSLLGMGQGLLDPAYSSLVARAVPQNLRGTAFGLMSTSLGVISLPAPYIGTLLWTGFGPQVPFYMMLGSLLLLVPIAWFKFRVPAQESTASAEATVAAAPAE